MKKLFLILLLSLASSANAQTTTISTQRDNNTSACATANSPVVGSQSCTSNTLQMTDDCSIPNSGNCNAGANTVIFNEAPANIADFTNDGMNPHTVPYSGFNGKIFGHWIPFFDGPGSNGDWVYTPKLPNPPGANTFSNHVVTGYSSHGANQVLAELKQFCRMGLDGFVDDWSGMQFSAASTTRKNEDAALQLMIAGMSSQSCAANMKFSLMLDQTIFHTSATCGTSSQTPSCAEKAWEDSLDWANLSTTFTSALDGNTYTGKGYVLNSHYLWMNCTSLGCSFTPEGTGHPVFGTFVSESDHFAGCTIGSPCAVWNDGVAGIVCTSPSDCWNKMWAGIVHHSTGYAHRPYFIFRNSFTNHAAQNDGSYRWANPTTTQSNWDKSGYDNWLDTAAAGPTCNGHKCVAFGAAYKGIDHAQSGFQSDNLIIDQRCAKTWLDTLKEPATRGFSSSNQMQAIQLNTISDYDEGTEIQTGIDSCYSLAATMGGDGHTLSYTMTTSDSSAAPLLPLNSTVNHFAIFYSSDGVNVTRIIPPVGMASAGSIDLNSLSIPAGSYTVYLKMVGQFSIKNKIVGPYSYTSSSGGGGGSSGTGPTNRIDINTQTTFHFVSDTGAANAYVVAVHAAPAYYSGMPLVFLPAHNNTTTSTINVNSLGAKTIKKQTSIGLVDISASDIQTSIVTFLIYDGTYFELLAPFTNSAATHLLLSSTHSDTTAAAAVRGDGIFAIGATPTWQRLAHSSATGGYFKWNGTDQVASTLAAAGIGTCTNQVVTANNADAAPTCTTITSAYTSGSFTAAAHNLLSAIHGDTTTASAVRGDIIAAIGASPLWTRVAHSSATGGYWKWNGTDVVASTGAAAGTGSCAAHQFQTTDTSDAAPTCAQPAVADLQNIAADAVVQNSSGSSAAPIATAVPNCANDGLHALIYSTSSHAWSCQTISGGGGLCPTCLLGPDSSVIGGIVGTFPSAGFPSPSTTLILDAFASGFSSNSGLVMPFSAGFRNMYLSLTSGGSGITFSNYTDFQRDATGSTPALNSRTGASGVVIYPNHATGVFSSTWPSVWPVQKGDVFEIASTSVGVSSSLFRGSSWEIVGSTSQLLGIHLNGQIALSTTAYTGPSQSNSVAITTEALQGVIIPYAATAKNLCIRNILTQPATGSLVITLRKNGSTSTALTITLPLSANIGTSCDFTNTVSLAAGDWIDFQLQNNATGNAALVVGITMELASPPAPATGMIVFGMGNQTIGSGTIRFASPFSALIGTSEANARAPLPRSVTMKNLSCIYTTPPGTNPVVVTIVQNGSASALTVSIPTTGAGTQTITDSTHTVAFVAGDQLSLQLNQISGTNPAISSCSVEVD